MSKKFTAQVFRWLHQVNGDDGLPPSIGKIAIYLSGCFNEDEGGTAWPGFDTVAKECRLSKSVVVTGLRLMAERGHIRVEPGAAGRGRSSRYWMIEKGRQADLFECPEKVGKKGLKSSRKGRLADLTLSKNQWGAKSAPHTGERNASLRSRQDLHVGGDPFGPPTDSEASKEESKQAATEEEKQVCRTAQQTGEPGQVHVTKAPHGGALVVPDAFDQLRAIWVRPWPDHDDAEARAAFADACAKGVGRAYILAAAAAWVEAADAPRFLPKLSTWLADGCYLREPPKKRGRSNGERADSNGRPRTNNRRPTPAQEMLAASDAKSREMLEANQ